MRSFLSLAGLFLVLSACSGTIDRRVDPDSPDAVGGAVLQSQDIRTMADQMARSLQTYGILTSAPPGERIAFHITEMRNESSDSGNWRMILESLQTDLFKALGGRVMIIDRTAEGLAAVQAERQAKRSGAVTAKASQRGDVAGSDYALMGTIQDRIQQSGKRKSAYYLVTFKLVNLETGEQVWRDKYETKFDSEKSVISR